MAATVEHFRLDPPKFDHLTRILIVIAPYYKAIADQLEAGAKAAISTANADFEIIRVPGALEISTAIRLAAASGRYDGYVALGCIIRGETTHYDTVCSDSARGLMLLGLEGHCIGNAILTVETLDQAVVRADAKGQNKGGGAAEAAMHLVALKRRMQH